MWEIIQHDSPHPLKENELADRIRTGLMEFNSICNTTVSFGDICRTIFGKRNHLTEKRRVMSLALLDDYIIVGTQYAELNLYSRSALITKRCMSCSHNEWGLSDSSDNDAYNDDRDSWMKMNFDNFDANVKHRCSTVDEMKGTHLQRLTAFSALGYAEYGLYGSGYHDCTRISYLNYFTSIRETVTGTFGGARFVYVCTLDRHIAAFSLTGVGKEGRLARISTSALFGLDSYDANHAIRDLENNLYVGKVSFTFVLRWQFANLIPLTLAKNRVIVCLESAEANPWNSDRFRGFSFN